MKCAPVAWRRLAGPVRTAAAGDCVWRPCCTYRLLCLSVRPSLSLFLSFSLCLSVSLSLWMARTSTGSSACAQQPAPLEQAPIPPKSASIHAAGPTPTCSGPLEVAMRPIRDARACFLCVATSNGGPLFQAGDPQFWGPSPLLDLAKKQILLPCAHIRVQTNQRSLSGLSLQKQPVLLVDTSVHRHRRRSGRVLQAMQMRARDREGHCCLVLNRPRNT